MSRIRRLASTSIRERVLFSFFIIFFLLIILTLIFSSYISEISSLIKELSPLNEDTIVLNDISISFESAEDNIDKYFMIGYEEYFDTYNRDKEDILASLYFMKSENKDRKLSDKLKETTEIKVDESIDSLNNLTGTLAVFEDRSIKELSPTEVNNIGLKAYSEIKKMKQIRNELISAHTSAIRKNTDMQKTLMEKAFAKFMMIIVLIIIIGLVLSYLMSYSISSDIRRISGTVDEISKGNFDVEIGQSNVKEIDILAESLKRIMKTMKLAVLEKGPIKIMKKQEPKVDQDLLANIGFIKSNQEKKQKPNFKKGDKK